MNYCVDFSVQAIVEEWVHKPSLNFSVHTKVDQMASVYVPTQYNPLFSEYSSSLNSSHLINLSVNGPLRSVLMWNLRLCQRQCQHQLQHLLMMTSTQTQRRNNLCFYVTIGTMRNFSVDVDANAKVTCEQGL